MKVHRKIIEISAEQFSKLNILNDVCSRHEIFNEEVWLVGVKDILGYMPENGFHYELKVNLPDWNEGSFIFRTPDAYDVEDFSDINDFSPPENF